MNISFRIDWFDLLAVQGTLKSLLQQHSSKASVLWHSALFMVQLSNPYMATGKIIALTIQIFVIKFMSTESVMLSNHLILCCPLQSFPASGSFQLSQLFASGDQSIGASASVLPMNIQD